ncbi:polysaccharide deacetylase family protein [Paenibacillus albiflavus]|uniref:Polysaccharide deacetylase family protein n=1 Tax=Paenibacillus albiflavus TaxID=2545760 RepID=A0A4R4E8V9_9BACL|nr:polysaccharide deacetylase family protein [Paenibacillus albiflavus]TCZ75300.1 polysaccharide deacetylase family protein [Paenibacillus albiflavus]
MYKFLIFTCAVLLIIACIVINPRSAASKSQFNYRNQVTVLVYHHIHKTDKSSVTITPELFREQLTFLAGKGFHFISFSEFQDYMNGKSVPNNAVLVTFDDGYESFMLEAMPVLEDLKIPAINHIITDTFREQQARHLSFLSKEQIGQITKQSSLFQFGCHSDSLHAKLPNGTASLIGRITMPNGQMESDQEYRERISNDTKNCINNIAEASSFIPNFYAYPFGSFNEEAKQIIRDAGIKYAFTTAEGIMTRKMDPMKIPRINAGSPWITPQKLLVSIKRKIGKTVNYANAKY